MNLINIDILWIWAPRIFVMFNKFINLNFDKRSLDKGIKFWLLRRTVEQKKMMTFPQENKANFHYLLLIYFHGSFSYFLLFYMKAEIFTLQASDCDMRCTTKIPLRF